MVYDELPDLQFNLARVTEEMFHVQRKIDKLIKLYESMESSKDAIEQRIEEIK